MSHRYEMRILRMLPVLLMLATATSAQAQQQPESQPNTGEKAKPTSRPRSGRASGPTPPPASKPKEKKIEPMRLRSAEAIAKKVIASINTRDRRALRALLVEANEYQKDLWPRFVEKQPALAKQNWKLHWMLLSSKSLAGTGDLLEEFRGKKLELISMKHDRVEDYGDFKLWRKVYLKIRVDGDREMVKRIFGAIIERGGKFYLLSYPS